MDSSPHRDIPKEPEAPMIHQGRNQTPSELLGDGEEEMEAARDKTLLAQQRFLKL